MTSVESMTEHLMAFVRCGSRQWAVQAALDYARMEFAGLEGLPAALDVAISRWRQERATTVPAASSSAPTSTESRDAPSGPR